jgi:four helix bundle suffix protein
MQIISNTGNYRKLASFQMATIVYDFTVEFCRLYVKDYRMRDQITQAARSGRQNIAEGCKASGTSCKTEMKLINVARASLEELLLDYEDYLRQHNLKMWDKEDLHAKQVRYLAYDNNKSYKTYKTYINSPEQAANVAICLIYQTSYLLHRQLIALEKAFLDSGGFTERLYNARMKIK